MQSRIIELNVENFMGVEAVDITPQDDLVVIGGNNGQGKSSVLNAIVAALGGKKTSPDVPVRLGKTQGRIEIRIRGERGELIVERTFTADGKTKLKVSAADGASYSKPQQILDDLVGAIGFDPHAFCRLDKRRQAEQLRDLVGLDTAEIETKRQRVYEDRTHINREVKSLESRLAAIPSVEVKGGEIIVSELLAELDRRDSVNRDITDRNESIANWDTAIAELESDNEGRREQIRKLQESIDCTESQIKEWQATRDKESAEVAKLTPENTEEIRQKIESAEQHNAKVRQSEDRNRIASELKTKQAESKRLAEAIAELDREKQKMLSDVAWPVKGLGFTDDGTVTYNGLPLSQSSSAEQLRVSLAMGMAANPKLRVLIIRDGSLIDDQTMDVIREMVAEADYQVWIEKVSGTGEGCTLMISEGRVIANEEVECNAPTT